MTPKYITVHNTANSSKGADAEMHSRYLHNGAGGRVVGWHLTVDDKEIYQHLPTDENGWHAGDGNGDGNMRSIGIEICENSDGDFDKAVKNAQQLIKKLMMEHDISINNVVPHKHWSGKNCPRLMLDNWNDFIEGVKGQVKIAKPSKPANISISKMAEEVIAGKHGNGHDARRKSLGISQAEYNLVRDEVNRKSGVKTASKPKGKSITQMAQEVIDGKHGNGHANRRKSLGVNTSVYNKVKREVNRRLSGKPIKSIAKPKSFKPGQKVTVKKSASKFATGESIASFVKGNSYKIKQVKSDRVLLDGIMSWVRKKDVY